jgi:23S rRNA (uridine2552-2'-O)-methyltransferase
MKRSRSSELWLKEHFSDPYVKRAQAEGWRSRAVFKLEEIQQRDALIKPGQRIVDLGAAPGGWSQMARKILGSTGQVIATDILEMPSLAGVTFILGDFREASVLAAVENELQGQPCDLVLSDMAPNMSGVDSVDQPAALYLCELALEFAVQHLKPNGAFLIKLFQGVGSDDYLKQVRAAFKTVAIRKPKASRARSTEVYVLARVLKKP